MTDLLASTFACPSPASALPTAFPKPERVCIVLDGDGEVYGCCYADDGNTLGALRDEADGGGIVRCTIGYDDVEYMSNQQIYETIGWPDKEIKRERRRQMQARRAARLNGRYESRISTAGGTKMPKYREQLEKFCADIDNDLATFQEARKEAQKKLKQLTEIADKASKEAEAAKEAEAEAAEAEVDEADL